MEELNFYQKLSDIQLRLKAPKNQYNNFGKYSYRNCEDILEAVKPLLNEHQLYINISDSIEVIGNRFYVKATVTVSDGAVSQTTTAYAREEEAKKGMDGSQVTGASSSYARKYALNGMFAIDDNKDSDATNQGQKTKQDKQEQPKEEKTYCCSNCGKPFQPFTARSTGKQFTAAQAYHMSEKKYGKALCGDCSGKFKQQEEMI